MLIKPYPLSQFTLPQEEACADKKTCRVFGPCGVGRKALFLNSFFLDRRYYIPWGAIQRVYKRVAMSRGGFTGKGVFGSIPYLVVEYDGGKERQFTFKYEEHVDQLLSCVEKEHPGLKLHSARSEAKLAQAEAEKAAKLLPELSQDAQGGVEALQKAIDYLNKRPDLSEELSQAARRQRAQSISKPAWRWAALAVILLGAAAAAFGVWQLAAGKREFGLYFFLFGLAAVFLFSGVRMGPTARSNKQSVARRWEKAKAEMENYVNQYPGQFPVPARYAHPVVLRRMQRALQEGAAARLDETLDVVKNGLKALNADVQVTQEEYDEVVAVKAMFLNENYQ